MRLVIFRGPGRRLQRISALLRDVLHLTWRLHFKSEKQAALFVAQGQRERSIVARFRAPLFVPALNLFRDLVQQQLDGVPNYYVQRLRAEVEDQHLPPRDAVPTSWSHADLYAEIFP